MQPNFASTLARRGSFALAAGVCLVGASPPTQAAVIEGRSSAYGVSVDSDIVDQNSVLTVVVGAELGPTPSVGGMAPAPYDQSSSLATASVSAGLLTTVGQGSIGASTGLLKVDASSNVDGAPGPRNADAYASVADVSISESLAGSISVLNIADVFKFDASLITSEAHVSGDYGTLVSSGDSVIIDISGAADGFTTFSVLGVNFDVAVDAQGRVVPNTMLTIDGSSSTLFGDLAGTDLTGSIDIILNEQIFSGDGISSAGIEVNALHITFNSVGAEFFSSLGIKLDDTNLLTGDVIIAHSEASLIAVPEPGTVGVLVAGAVMLGLRRRRRL